jgi:hypothetical protein
MIADQNVQIKSKVITDPALWVLIDSSATFLRLVSDI